MNAMTAIADGVSSLLDGSKVKRLKRIDTYFPHVKELLPIADQCREMEFTEEMTRQLVCFKPIGFRVKFYLREHGKEFKTEHSTATIEKKTP